MKHFFSVLIIAFLVCFTTSTSQAQSGGRKILSKCTDFQKAADWHESGVAVVRICVNASGNVEAAEFVPNKSSQFSPELVKLLTECAMKYIYEPEAGAPTVCGEIIIRMGR